MSTEILILLQCYVNEFDLVISFYEIDLSTMYFLNEVVSIILKLFFITECL